jgi:Fe-S cluster assembly iron-binding protein IscA
MANPVPYVCARCLRASRISARSSARLRAGVQQYHTRSTLFASQAEQRARPSRITHFLSSPFRTISTTRPLSKPPSTETVSTATTHPTRPPPILYTSTTKTILNPRLDEETGLPMTIEITPRASKRLTQIMTKDANPSLCLRVNVESGGCHGFQYLMSLTSISKISPEEDTLFIAADVPHEPLDEGADAEWRSVAEGKPKVVMDEPSLELLKGSKIDFTQELIGSQFKIVDNPRASSSCGCGTSFDVKV